MVRVRDPSFIHVHNLGVEGPFIEVGVRKPPGLFDCLYVELLARAKAMR